MHKPIKCILSLTFCNAKPVISGWTSPECRRSARIVWTRTYAEQQPDEDVVARHHEQHELGPALDGDADYQRRNPALQAQPSPPFDPRKVPQEEDEVLELAPSADRYHQAAAPPEEQTENGCGRVTHLVQAPGRLRSGHPLSVGFIQRLGRHDEGEQLEARRQ
jgi:hypothetical protein